MNRTLTWIVIVGGVLLFLVCGGLFTIGTFLESGRIPDTEVVRGDALRAEARVEVAEAIALREGEELLWYYGYGISFEAEGSVVTDQRAVSYDTEDGERWVQAVELDEVTEWWIYASESWIEDTRVALAKGEETVWLLLSTERDLDDEVLAYLRERVATAPYEGTVADFHALDFDEE